MHPFKLPHFKWPALVAGALLAFSPARAADVTWTFDDEDPFLTFDFIDTTQPDFVWGGQDFDDWFARGASGEDGDGFFSISEATGSTSTIAILPDIDDGKFVQSFKMTMDLRMGNGTTDRPADGISINFARANDPILETPNAGNAATSGAAETGTQTGVAVLFDTWAGNTLPDDTDVEGVIVRVDNVTVGKFPMPVRHGDPEDIESLQTGPQGDPDTNGFERGDPNILSWQPLEVEVDEVGILNVRYKNVALVENFSTGFFPSPGQIVLMGRTGGANEVHHVDNLRLTTELAKGLLIGGIDLTDTGFFVTVAEITSTLNRDSVVLTLDGAEVSPTSIDEGTSPSGDTVTLNYDSGDRWASGSQHTIGITALDANGDELSTAVTLTADIYTTITPGQAVANADTSTSGFLMRVIQSNEALANDTQTREDHLKGLVGGPNEIDDFGSDNGIWTVELLNMEQDGNNSGVFQAGLAGSQDVQDDFIPGVPGFADAPTDNVTAEINTILRVPEAGFYTFGFNSDDGYKVEIGTDLLSRAVIGEFSGGRGNSGALPLPPASLFKVYFEEAGDYPVRGLWYEGGGGANLEFLTVSPNLALINDTSNGGLEAFAALPPVDARIISVIPAVGATGVPANADVVVNIEGGADISIKINGEDASVSTSGTGLVTATVNRDGELWAPGEEVSIEISHNGLTREPYTFTVENWVTIPAGGFRTDAGTGSDSGFSFRVHQIATGRGNSTADAEAHLAGDLGDNIADPLGGTVSTDSALPGIFFNVDLINYDQAGAAQGRFRDLGDGSTLDRQDGFIPGIPGLEGGTDNIAAEILSFIEFPQGYHRMVFNSDDGFRVTLGHEASDDALELGVFDGGRGASDTTFAMNVPVAGVYPIRAIWYEGGGGANLEWSTVAKDGTRILINDDGGLQAFRDRSGTVDPAPAGGITGISVEGGNVTITYEGTLKSSEAVEGPYNAVGGASSPYAVQADKDAEFFIAD